jgi:exodeoxyribonuclease V alpha subunit
MSHSEQIITLEGTLERIIYYNEATHYTVGEFRQETQPQGMTIVGNLMGVTPGESLRITGKWIHDRKYGRQFSVDSYTPRFPVSVAGIEKYLGCGLIKGIGEVFARRIVKRFGEESLQVIDTEPERLAEVEGIGPKRIACIVEAWQKQKHIHDVMLFLQEHNVPLSYAIKIYKHYGTQAIRVLQTNPYQLALDIQGIGFKTADTIAQRLGIAADSPLRAKAGVLHIVNEFVEAGHTFCPIELLVEKTEESLEIDAELARHAIDVLRREDRLVVEQLPDKTTAVFPKALYVCERGIVGFLAQLVETAKPYSLPDTDMEIEKFEQEYRFTLADAQRNAVRRALAGGVMVITGGPGTGKTTIVRAIIKILGKHGIRILLCAPTGRAAKRLSDVTGMSAATIHRMLHYKPREGHFLFNEANPLRADLIIVDESSMMDVPLSYYLLRAILPTASVIFVGDVDQLPSVGPGNVLADFIASRIIPVVTLDKVFRQARRSLIITNAHRINKGEFPILPSVTKLPLPDFFFISKSNPEEALQTIKSLVLERIPQRFGFHPVNDIQVITPMYKGLLGANNLNNELQSLLNPDPNVLHRGGTALKVGDKVMQLKNDYQKDVFNGDIGVISAIDREFHSVKVLYEGRTVEYDYDELDEICLAYAISVHKSQGSEYKAVVIPIHPQHYILLQRNLLYTALTRGKKLVCLVGTKQAMAIAIRNNRIQVRFSGLRQWLSRDVTAFPDTATKV